MIPKIAIVAESASQNIGDQAIYEALSAEVQTLGRPHPVFLSGPLRQRGTTSAGASSTERSSGFNLYRSLPSRLRAHIFWSVRGGRGQAYRYFESQLADCDGVVVGGGQLVKDNDTLFCRRLSLIQEICRSQGKSYGLVGVGVGGLQGTAARKARFFLQAASFVGVRDALSRQRSLDLLNGSKAVLAAPDLAFLGKTQTPTGPSTGRKKAALNIMAFELMRSEGKMPSALLHEDYIRSWLETGRLLHERGWEVCVVTTGTPADIRDAHLIAETLQRELGQQASLEQPDSPEAYRQLMAQTQHLVASRMHAGILAQLQGVNVLCLNWDDKVKGVWSMVDEVPRVIECTDAFGTSGPASVVGQLLGSAHNPLAAHHLQQARDAIADCVHSVVKQGTARQ